MSRVNKKMFGTQSSQYSAANQNFEYNTRDLWVISRLRFVNVRHADVYKWITIAVLNQTSVIVF